MNINLNTILINSNLHTILILVIAVYALWITRRYNGEFHYEKENSKSRLIFDPMFKARSFTGWRQVFIFFPRRINNKWYAFKTVLERKVFYRISSDTFVAIGYEYSL
jgi:hypothetical protein